MTGYIMNLGTADCFHVGTQLKCTHIIAETDQRFIKQSNLKLLTEMHVETPGIHVWLLGV